ncbi:type II toxin-antitoxin system RelB/DinJ family antitoxin [Candidatus Saccharibacteria bacterium]|nr:type II toxin-antitoxin system RelB/DinJ family antitoxin [Candidatus Saccharibacteria bacterium]MCB9835024.1 type II toxin-antitoxin system RelB/DinJ family antitoxin [Candidatus Nomurabacteria bacterium]
MSQVITIKTDDDTKRAAQQLAKDAGITLSSLINSYLKQVVVTRHIEIYVPEPMSIGLEEKIAQVERDREDGQISSAFDNVEDFLQDLKS